MSDRPNRPEVVVIGIDGASWNVLDVMIEAGDMPNLERLMSSGVSGDLTSVIPPISAPAWTSFMTGKNPGKHRIFAWTETLNREFTSVNARRIDGKTLWQLLGERGKKVGVFNVPMTYPLPSYPINGFLIAGSLTPSVKSDFTYPAELRDELMALVDNYIIYTPWQEYEILKDGRRSLMKALVAKLKQRKKVALHLLDRYETDFFIVVFAGNDRASHCMWNCIMPEAEAALDDEVREIHNAMHAYYRQLDEAVGEILDRCGPDALVFVISDHGFGPARKDIYINKWLVDEGFLASASNPRSKKVRDLIRAFAHRLGITRERWNRILGAGATKAAQELVNTVRIDWARTRAYSNGSNGIQINLKGREPQGIVEPGSEYEDVRAQFIEQLKHLRDPETGRPVMKAVYPREDIYEGPHVQRAPDILMVMEEGYVAYEPDVDIDETFSPTGWRNGDHKLEGILVVAGEHVKKNAFIDGARIVDLTPTILYAMGQPIPDDMDGRVLTELFEETFVRANAPMMTKAAEIMSGDEELIDRSVDDDLILERLRGLGYVS
jgi:predicted AlkP superfamily phosphohydrolase/phosphomutase